MNRPSLGNGYGINRNAGGASVQAIAKPPMRNVTVSPGNKTSRSAVGKSGDKHFSGATRPGEKND